MYEPSPETLKTRPSPATGAIIFLLAVTPLTGHAIPVDVEGAPDAVARNIREHLALEHLPCDIRPLQLGQRLNGADQRISQALRSLGYYSGQWQLERTRDGDDCPTVRVQVQPGEPVIVRELAIQVEGVGADDQGLAELILQLPLAEGRQLNHGDYETARNQLMQRARQLGYFEARFSEHSLRVDPDTHAARIRLVLASGPRYRFGEVSYAETSFSNSFLRRYQDFDSGDPFDARALITLQNRLLNAGYFDRVSVDQSEPDPATGRVDVKIDLTTRSRYQSTFGAGASTDKGPRVNYTLRNRHFNDSGDHFLVSSQWSPVESRASLQLEQPGEEPHREKTRWSLGWQREDTDTALSRGWRAEVAKVRVLDNDWVQTPSLTFLSEDFEVGGDSERSMLLYPGVQWSRTQSNDPRYPTRGWRLGLAVRGALEGVVSDSSFAQVEANARLIFPLGKGRLISRARAAGTWVEDFGELPATLRFFAGGDNSVRGFEYESLGPKNDEGEVRGGRHLLTGSVEYDYPVFKQYGVAVFYDIGNAFNASQFRLHDSVGVGARWRSPIGPVRLDFAVPLDEGGFRIHLSMGPDL